MSKLFIQSQDPTEVYVGRQGHIAICQTCPVEGEKIVTITPENAKAIAKEIVRLIPDAKQARAEFCAEEEKARE